MQTHFENLEIWTKTVREKYPSVVIMAYGSNDVKNWSVEMYALIANGLESECDIVGAYVRNEHLDITYSVVGTADEIETWLQIVGKH